MKTKKLQESLDNRYPKSCSQRLESIENDYITLNISNADKDQWRRIVENAVIGCKTFVNAKRWGTADEDKKDRRILRNLCRDYDKQTKKNKDMTFLSK